MSIFYLDWHRSTKMPVISPPPIESIPPVIFVPFMIGALSLIAFLGLRNIHLSRNVRDICKEMRCQECEDGWKANWAFELSLFVSRYMWSNMALIFAIWSVFLFGAMIGSAAIIAHEFTWSILAEIPMLFLILGGTLGTIATVMSVRETRLARRSLSAHVAATIVGSSFDPSRSSIHSSLDKIEKCIRHSLDSEMHGKLRNAIKHLTNGSEEGSSG